MRAGCRETARHKNVVEVKPSVVTNVITIEARRSRGYDYPPSPAGRSYRDILCLRGPEDCEEEKSHYCKGSKYQHVYLLEAVYKCSGHQDL